MVGVIGASYTNNVDEEFIETSNNLGHQIASNELGIIIGASLGFPWTVMKSSIHSGNRPIIVSPANSSKEHETKYRLPLSDQATYIYTGLGRDIKNNLVINSSHLIIFGPSTLDSIDSFLHALSSNKPIGILEGPWDTSKYREILSVAPPLSNEIIRTPNPQILLDSLLAQLSKNIH